MAAELHAAVESGNLEEVQRLLQQDPNLIKTKDTETPLHLAAKHGNVEIVKALLEAGADVDIRFKFLQGLNPGFSLFFRNTTVDAFDIAAAFGHASVIEILLETKGYEPLSRSTRLQLFGALDFAAIFGHSEVLKMLLTRLSVSAALKSKALCSALQHGHIECARLLISSGAGVNKSAQIYDFYAPAQYPVFLALVDDKGFGTVRKTDQVAFDLFKMLLEAGADLNVLSGIRFNYGWFGGDEDESYELSLLSCAACFGRFKVVSYLLANGADITAKDNNGWTAFHFAVAGGNLDMVEYLLKAGASDQVTWDITLAFNGDRTALDVIGMFDSHLLHSTGDILEAKYVKIIKLLVDNGADLEAKNEFGNTPLHSACLIGDRTAPAGCYIYYQNGVHHCLHEDKEYVRAHMQTLKRVFPMISAFLQAGANPNAFNKNRQNPLHVLLMDVMEAIQALSNHYTYSDCCKWSAVKEHSYIQQFFTSLKSSIHVLVEAGADLNQKNIKGFDPLHEMLHGLKNYYKEKNEEFFEDIELVCEYPEDYEDLCHGQHFIPQGELDSIIVELVICGVRSWEAVPEALPGLQRALFAVWKRGNDEELRYLYERLEPSHQARLRTCLLVFNRLLPGEKALHVQISAAAV